MFSRLLKRMPECIAALLIFSAGTLLPAQGTVAATPPLGWNSWDSYGLSVTEAEWKGNVAWFHEHLQPAGWQYVVLDEGWYLAHPENAGGKGDQGFTLDANGRFSPAPNRFPQGVEGLAHYAHGMGLKFGIHIIRGIPKDAVERNLPIEQSTFRATDAAETSDTCAWNPDNFGVRDNAAGQAYYDSLMKLYAGWGIDFLKVDCITKPYKSGEIRMIRNAIDKTGRPIVLSLSPGPTPIDQADDLVRRAQMWRISDDVWDVWSDPKLTPASFPETIRYQFDTLAKWMPIQQPGRWPDADMLAIGYLGPRPGWGKPRQSRLTPEETRSLLTLWSIARSPLILGSNLLQMPSGLEALLRNKEWLAVNQAGAHPQQVFSEDDTIVWTSEMPNGKGRYVALFNVGDAEKKIRVPWARLGLPEGDHPRYDIWARKSTGRAAAASAVLPAHGAALWRVD